MRDTIIQVIIKTLLPIALTSLIAAIGHITTMEKKRAETQTAMANVIQQIAITVIPKDCEAD